MLPKYNSDLIPNAKDLRKNMTKEERHLWYDFLRTYPVKFVRQKVLGKYIADFYCAAVNLVIELDGSQHYQEVGLKYDAVRTEFLQDYGIQVIRIPNNMVNNNFSGVCKYIDLLRTLTEASMDTLMDKLAQKLNAQEMIRANGEAEAEQMQYLTAKPPSLLIPVLGFASGMIS